MKALTAVGLALFGAIVLFLSQGQEGGSKQTVIPTQSGSNMDSAIGQMANNPRK